MWAFPLVIAILLSSLLASLWPHSCDTHGVRKYFIDHLMKSFYAISPATDFPSGYFIYYWLLYLLSVSFLMQLSPAAPVTSCRDGYYDTAGVSSLALPIGKQLRHQVACSYFEQELYVKWSKQLN